MLDVSKIVMNVQVQLNVLNVLKVILLQLMDQNVKLNAVTIVLLAIAKTQINVCLATQALSLIQLLENVSPT